MVLKIMVTKIGIQILGHPDSEFCPDHLGFSIRPCTLNGATEQGVKLRYIKNGHF